MYIGITQNALGLGPKNAKARLLARGGAYLRGQVGMLDFANSDADVSNNRPGDANSGFVNAIRVTAAGVKYGAIVIFDEDVLDDHRGYAHFRSGEVYAYVHKGSGSIAKGDPLVAVSGQLYLDGALAAGNRVVALALEAATTPTTATLIKVSFDGINGLATIV